jgi:hypothetical protein
VAVLTLVEGVELIAIKVQQLHLAAQVVVVLVLPLRLMRLLGQ